MVISSGIRVTFSQSGRNHVPIHSTANDGVLPVGAGYVGNVRRHLDPAGNVHKAVKGRPVALSGTVDTAGVGVGARAHEYPEVPGHGGVAPVNAPESQIGNVGVKIGNRRYVVVSQVGAG